MAIFLLIVGLVLLVVGAEALVRGASRLASAVGVSPLVIGLTVVAFGTSTPEMATSVVAGWKGQPDIALGNVIGSNIFNVLFILGISALIVPLVVSQQLVRLDVPVMIGVSVLVFIMALDGRIVRVEGAILFAGLIAYTMFLIRLSRRESKQVEAEYAQEYGGPTTATPAQHAVNLLFILGGLALLVLGSKWLVDGAIVIAQYFGVSQLIIGLTIVAAGTSLPEVATSILASIRGERDIAVGNAIGSNIFNLLGVLGLASAISPAGIAVSDTALRFDLPIMVAVAVACLPIFFTGHIIARWEGALFLGYYIAYTVYLVLAATGNTALPLIRAAMMWFVIPLTLTTLTVVTVRAVAGQRSAS